MNFLDFIMANESYTIVNCSQIIFYCMGKFYAVEDFDGFYLAIPGNSPNASLNHFS